MTRLIAHDPPFTPDTDASRRQAREYAEELGARLAAGRRGDAVELFLSLVGMPPETIAGMRQSPAWPGMEQLAPSLAHDSAVMGHAARGGTVPLDELTGVEVDVLVLVGGQSPPFMADAARRVAGAVAHGRVEVLEGQGHVVEPAVLTEAVAAWVGDMTPDR
jgi:pimeloyl-ACP methyl ester carboxylesterase